MSEDIKESIERVIALANRTGNKVGPLLSDGQVKWLLGLYNNIPEVEGTTDILKRNQLLEDTLREVKKDLGKVIVHGDLRVSDLVYLRDLVKKIDNIKGIESNTYYPN